MDDTNEIDIDALLHPCSARQLVGDLWERSSLYIPGSVDKFRHFRLDIDEYFRLCCQGPLGLMAQFFDHGEHKQIYIKGSAARTLYDAGASICLPEVDTMVPRLGRLARAAERAFGLVGKVIMNSYLSSSGGGFGLHFDDRCVFTLQLAGNKRWFYSDTPMIVSPPRNLVCGSADEQRLRSENGWVNVGWPAETELRQQVLSPGDILYLPAGTPHRTEAGDYSLAVTISCLGRRFPEMIAKLMNQELARNVAWQRRLPALPAADRHAIMKRLASEQLRQVRAWIEGLDADELAAAWQKEVG